MRGPAQQIEIIYGLFGTPGQTFNTRAKLTALLEKKETTTPQNTTRSKLNVRKDSAHEKEKKKKEQK